MEIDRQFWFPNPDRSQAVMDTFGLTPDELTARPTDPGTTDIPKNKLAPEQPRMRFASPAAQERITPQLPTDQLQIATDKFRAYWGDQPGNNEPIGRVAEGSDVAKTMAEIALQSMQRLEQGSRDPQDVLNALALTAPLSMGAARVRALEAEGGVELGALGGGRGKVRLPGGEYKPLKGAAPGPGVATAPPTPDNVASWWRALDKNKGDALRAAEDLGIRDAEAKARLGKPEWARPQPTVAERAASIPVRKPTGPVMAMQQLQRAGFSPSAIYQTLAKEFGTEEAQRVIQAEAARAARYNKLRVNASPLLPPRDVVKEADETMMVM